MSPDQTWMLNLLAILWQRVLGILLVLLVFCLVLFQRLEIVPVPPY